jgi:hypothetical protein
VSDVSQNGDRTSVPEEYVLRLGGMALRNGLLIHGPTSWSAAARDDSGEIQVASGRKPALAPDLAARVPLVRGPLRLAEAFMLIPTVRMQLRAARLPFEDARVIGAMLVASSASRALRRRGSSAAGELLQAVLGLAPAMVALSDRDLAAYHGVEHKAIGAYEAGSDDPASATKEHERCGSNLVVPMLVLSAAGQLLLERALERPGPQLRDLRGARLPSPRLRDPEADRHQGADSRAARSGDRGPARDPPRRARSRRRASAGRPTPRDVDSSACSAGSTTSA